MNVDDIGGVIFESGFQFFLGNAPSVDFCNN